MVKVPPRLTWLCCKLVQLLAWKYYFRQEICRGFLIGNQIWSGTTNIVIPISYVKLSTPLQPLGCCLLSMTCSLTEKNSFLFRLNGHFDQGTVVYLFKAITGNTDPVAELHPYQSETTVTFRREREKKKKQKKERKYALYEKARTLCISQHFKIAKSVNSAILTQMD